MPLADSPAPRYIEEGGQSGLEVWKKVAISLQRHCFDIEQRLWKDTHAGITYALALLMAAGLVTHLYPLEFLAGYGGFFEGGDAATNVAGWLFYRQDTWHFPLLKTDWLSYPEGTSIAFTDSIPLLALPLKLLADVLPENFHYFGLWHALCYVLQATGAVFLIRSLGIRHLPGAILASAFALCWPALTFRFGHAALMTQGLLLIALGIYLRGCAQSHSPNRYCVQLTALSAIALLIHPYLLAMIYPLLLVYLIQQWRAGVIETTRVIHWIMGSLVLLVAILIAGGYFIGKDTAAGGYGVFSLNLLAPFCGGLICAFVDGTGGQGEGFNYFGAGLLTLMPLALILDHKALTSAIGRHRYLFLLLLLFTLYALSNRLYLGKWELVSVDLPYWLQGVFGIFRVGGRFFWLVGYCVLFFVLALLLRRRSPVILALMVLAFAVQWFDTRSLRESVRAQSHQVPTTDIALWQMALNDIKYLDLYPSYGCGAGAAEGYAHYQYIAARTGLRINTGYTARQTMNCAAKSNFAQHPPKAGHAYVHLDFAANRLDLPPLYRHALKAGDCAVATWHLLCRSGRDQVQWEGLATPIESSKNALHQYWSAEHLPSVIGSLQDGRLVPQHPGMVGYLSYGPYISLPAGIYSFRVDYLSNARPQVVVGEWDVIGEEAGELRTLARGTLQGSDARTNEVHGFFVLDHDVKRLEIRLLSNGGDVQLSGITLIVGHDSAVAIDP
jgi:hypothetical protein